MGNRFGFIFYLRTHPLRLAPAGAWHFGGKCFLDHISFLMRRGQQFSISEAGDHWTLDLFGICRSLAATGLPEKLNE